MNDHVSSALFVYTSESLHFRERLLSNTLGTEINPVAFDALMADPASFLGDVGHVVVSGSLDVIKTVLDLSMTYRFGVGILPMASQKELVKFYDLPKDLDAAVDLALRKDTQNVGLTLCNGKILLFKATVGWIPVLDAPGDTSRWSLLVSAVKKFINIKLLKFDFRAGSERKITTAATGCMIVLHHKGNLAEKLIPEEGTDKDTMVSMLATAPISIIAYFRFLLRLLGIIKGRKRLPSAVGYLRSTKIVVEPETELDVLIDGEPGGRTPLCCEVIPEAVHVNIGPGVRVKSEGQPSVKEKIDVHHLPMGKELPRAIKKQKIPFFSYASEERFRDLFTALREDSQVSGTYLVLMVLSTLLATVGLYLNSASVIIGAMLLAPLMTPIISLAMGLLRGYPDLIKKSLGKIFAGVAIALLASALITLLFPHKPITGEMQARLNPSLLDLAVAIVSGIAAAYSKSFKEIIQSLAGVAIAVALVPPLSVAGIGIGQGDLHFFAQAFLLFFTNLIGIILAAAFTFRVLGFSPAVRGNRNIWVVLLTLVLIAIPLYISYDRIVEKRIIENRWQKERFLVNGKYIIIQKADVSWRKDKEVVVMELLVRDFLNREDLNEFRKKIEDNFSGKPIIRVKTVYIP